MNEVVFLNGKILPLKEAKISISTPGVLYGWGLFETMRSYNNKIVYFNQHLKRIKDSSRLLGIKLSYSMDRLKDIIKQAVKINCFRDSYVRLTVWKSNSGADILVVVKKYHPYSSEKYKRGFQVCLSSFRQNENSVFTRLKTTNYLLYQLSFKKAKDKGFDEAIILNNRGLIAEGSRSNIFFIKEEELFTPSLECGCLDGITRRVIFDLAKEYKIKIYEGNFTLQDLYRADEAFLTNSLMGVMPLERIEKHRIAKGVKNFRLTRFFISKYKNLLKNGTEKNKIAF